MARTTNRPAAAPARHPPLPPQLEEAPNNKAKLATWADDQREKYALGRLDQRKVAQLEAMDGWSWDIIDPRCLERLSILKALGILSPEEESHLVNNVHYQWLSFDGYTRLAQEFRAGFPENAPRPPLSTVYGGRLVVLFMELGLDLVRP